MVTHEAFLTKFFNAYLAGFGNWLLALFGLKAENPAEPWPDYMVMQITVFALIVILFLVLRSQLSMDKPGGFQHLFELIHDFLTGESKKNVGHESPKHLWIFETLFIFIMVCNLIGVIPGLLLACRRACCSCATRTAATIRTRRCGWRISLPAAR